MEKKSKELVIQSLIEAVPYVGGSLSTLYFGNKQEKRFARVESFYNELKSEIDGIKGSIKDIGNHNQQELSAILENLHEKVETENIESKKKYYKKYFKSTLISPVNGNYDERKLFLDILSDVTPFQIELVAFLAQQQTAVSSTSVGKPGIDKSIIIGSLNHLRNHGIIEMELESISFTNMGGGMSEKVKISSFGLRFHNFCLQ